MLYHSSLITGEKLWFAVKHDGSVHGIRLSFDNMLWFPFGYEGTDVMPDKLVRTAHESEDYNDYYKVVKTIFEKRKGKR